MRPLYYTVAKHLKTGREHALVGDSQAAIREFQAAIRALRTLPPERVRDTLLAHAFLNQYQTLKLIGKSDKKAERAAFESLQYGVSYARSTRDPVARALAEECLVEAS
jgi:bacterioferritin (cytochrome b1)